VANFCSFILPLATDIQISNKHWFMLLHYYYSSTKGTVLPSGNSFTKTPFFLYTIYVLFTFASILARSPFILIHLSAQANSLFCTLLCFSNIDYRPPRYNR